MNTLYMELFSAIENGDVEAVSAAIQNGADIEYECHDIGHEEYKGITPLMWAACCSEEACVECLIKAGADVNHQCDMWSPLAVAVHNLTYDCDEKYIIPVIRLLIAAGADVNVIEPGLLRKGTLAMQAANWGKANILKILLDAGADSNAVDELGNTALHMNALDSSCSSAAVVSLLLEAGADPNILTQSSELPSALMIYCSNSDCQECVKLLLDAGADVTVENAEGWTALDVALEERWYGYSDSRSIEDRIDLCEILLAAGADGELALLYSVWLDDEEGAQILLECKVNPDITEAKTGLPLLVKAVQMKNIKMLRLLLEHGAEIEVTDSVGNTALMMAIKDNYVDGVRLLTRAGANWEWVNEEGFCPAEYIEEKEPTTEEEEQIQKLYYAGMRHDMYSPLEKIAKAGDVKALENLLNEKEWTEENKQDALFAAAYGLSSDCVRLLLQKITDKSHASLCLEYASELGALILFDEERSAKQNDIEEIRKIADKIESDCM